MAEGDKKLTKKGLAGTTIPGTTLTVVREYTIESKTGKRIQKVTCQCSVCKQFSNTNREVEYDYTSLKSDQPMCKTCVQRIVDSRRTDNGKIPNFNIEYLTLKYHEQLILFGSLHPGLKAGREYINTLPGAGKMLGVHPSLEVGNMSEKREESGRLAYRFQVVGYKGVYLENFKQGKPQYVLLKCLLCDEVCCEEIEPLLRGGTPAECRCRSKKGASKRTTASVKALQGSTGGIDKGQEQADKFAEDLKSANSDCFTYGYAKDNQVLGKVICSKCGYARGDYAYDPARKDWHLGECEGCTHKKKEPLYRGKYGLNYVGKVFNGLEVTKQYTSPDAGFLCDVKCISRGKSKEGKCGIIRTGLPLHEVVNRKIFCDCGNYTVYVECKGRVLLNGKAEPCDNLIPVAAKDILKNGFVLCKQCRSHKVTPEDFEKKAVFKDTEDSFMLADEKLKKEAGVGETSFDLDNNLIKSKKELYLGIESSQLYRRAACLSHNTHLVISDSEADEFDCSNFCSNIQQHLLPDLTSKQVQSQLKL